MNIISIILTCSMAGFGVLGLIIGIVKGFTNVKSWGIEYVLVAVLSIALANVIRGATPDVATQFYAILALVATLIVSVMMLFARMRSSIAKSIEKYQQRMYYMQYENAQIRENEIVDALYVNDQRKYKKLTKPKVKYKKGGWGVVNRVFGGITLAVKGVMMTLIFGCTLLTVVDLSTLASLDEFSGQLGMLGEYFSGDQWTYLKEFVFDFALIGLLFAVIKNGFNGGLLNSLWGIVVLILVVLALFIGWMLSGTPMFAGAVEGLTKSFSSIYDQVPGGFITAELQATISRGIITAGIFIVELVFIIILTILVPNLIHTARRGSTFRVIDGFFGAAVSAILLLVVMWILGGILQTVSDMEFMTHLNTYFELSRFATYFYTNNILIALYPDIFSAIPLRRLLNGEGL